MGAVVLAVITAPLHRRIVPSLGRKPAALIIAIACALLLAAPAALLLSQAILQAPTVLHRVLTSAAFARLATVHLGPLDVGAQIADIGKGFIAWASTRAMMAAGTVTRTVINLLLALVGQYYLLLTGAELWRETRTFIPFSLEGADRLALEFVSITRAGLLGVVATAFSQGITVALGFQLVSLPNPAFWGAMTGLVSILPILGSSIIWAPAVVFLLLQDRPGAALTLGLIGLVIASNVDNIIRPFIYRRVSGLHPIASLLGAFAGMQVLGFAGLLLGPLALAYCIELFRLYKLEYSGGERSAGDPDSV